MPEGILLDILSVVIVAAGAFAAVLGIVLLSGFLPVSALPSGWWTPLRGLLVAGNGLLILALGAAVFFVALESLSWAVAVIAAGIAALAAPPVFQQLPEALRDRPQGLALYPILGAGLLLAAGFML